MKNEPISQPDAAPLDPAASIALGLATQLAQSCATIESRFSGTGDRLTECAIRLNEVSAAHEGLPGAMDSADFASAEASLASISRELAHFGESDGSEDTAIVELRDLAARMGEPLVELRRVMLLLEIISANAGILAAELSGTNGELSAFTGDMVSLAHGALNGIAGFEHLRLALLSQLTGAAAAGDRFARTHADTLTHVRERLDGHVEAILRHRRSGGEQYSDNAAATRRIAARVADVVSAMQIGDITRQRIEHVQQGLERLSEQLQPQAETGDAAGDTGDDTDARRAATAARLRSLQQAQLRSAIEEFGERTGFIARSLPELAADTEQVLADGDRQARALTDTSSDTLTAMLEDLRKVRRLFSDFRAVRGEADRMSAAVAEGIENMVAQLRTIDRIERQIRVLSFNMAAQCNRLGEEGRAMMVITQQLRELAIRTEQASELVRANLGKGAEAAVGIAGAKARSEKLSELDGATEDAITRIEAASEEMRGHARTLSERGPGALDILRKAADAAQTLDEAEAAWNQVLHELEAGQGAAPDADAEIDHILFADLRRAYTMDSERRIHDEMIGGGTSGTDSEDNEPAAAADDSDDDFLAALF